MINKIKKLSRWQYFICFFFLIIFLIGIFTFKDYGIADDERIERNHDLVTHYYIQSLLNGKKIADGNPTWNVKTNPLEKLVEKEKIERRFFAYRYRYYGVTIQMPTVLVEQVFNYNLDISHIYQIRHMYNFLIFFISLIYFYKLLKNFLIKDEKLSFVATLFLILSPRIYGDAFYNIKDLVFMSLFIINIYYSFKYLDKNSFKNFILLCLISAVTINCRIIGGIILLLTIIFEIIKKKRKAIVNIIELVLITYIIYILITPASWINMLNYPIDVLNFFFNYSDPYSHKIQTCFYFNKTISSEKLPWHYLPVWIFITTPFIYILLSIIGTFSEWLNFKIKKINTKWLFCNIILILMLLIVIIFRPTLYTGWRHFYFIYPLIIINAIYGLKYLLDVLKKYNKIILIIVLINLIYIAGWMIKNHPYQYEYFQLGIRKYAISNFETNYWMVSNSDAFKYLAKQTNKKIKVYANPKVGYYTLSKNERKRIKLVKTKKEADYIIDNDKYKKKKYKEITNKKIDGYRLYTIYKK